MKNFTELNSEALKKEYKRLRKIIGTQTEVAKNLGITRQTISYREALSGKNSTEVSPEQCFALVGLLKFYDSQYDC